MKTLRLVVSAIVSMASVYAVSGNSLLVDCDFGYGVEVHNSGVGSFDGPLPKGCGDNFSGWSAGRVKTVLREEDGIKHTHFETSIGSQFSIGNFEMKGPCFYRLIIKARAIADPISFGLRMMGPPYSMYWSGKFKSPEWREQTFLIKVGKTDPVRCGIFMWTPVGGCDIASVKLEPADEAAFMAQIRRPNKSVRQFFRHTRFPLGLPAGWNVNRDCVDGVCVSEDGCLKAIWEPTPGVVKQHDFGFWTEPIQTNEPDKPLRIAFEYKCDGSNWRVEARTDTNAYFGGMGFPATTEWKRAVLTVNEPSTAAACSFCVLGKGTFYLKSVKAWAGDEEPGPDREAEVAIAPEGGEIATMTRIHFVDERPRVRFAAVGDYAGASLAVAVQDIYGRKRTLSPIKLSSDGTGVIDYAEPGSKMLGQYRILAVIVRGDRKISPVEEFVMTRLARPVAWNRDAPDSPFAAHFMSRGETIAAMKAMGVNWARFHDACTDLSGWAHLEPRQGEWHWRDRDIARFRDRHVKIYAQLGTAPAWVTHYGDLGCESMGYFERYLRPTNDVATVNYVKTFVGRYKGIIDDYFIWNEPWGGWWSSARDIKFYDKDRAGYDFGIFSRLVYKAAKEANPNVNVCGYNTFVGECGRNWCTGVHSGGAFEACDALDFHYYASSGRCKLDRDDRITDAPFAPVRKDYPDLAGKPVYMSEGHGITASARHSGFYRHSVPWKPDTQEELAAEADNVCRYVISLLAENVKRVFLYSAHCYTSLGVRPGDLQLLAADGFPHASSVGFSNMARLIEGKRFVGIEYGEGDSGAYVFRGGNSCVRVFTGLTKAAALALPNAIDVFGNPITAETFLPGTLVYCEGK